MPLCCFKKWGYYQEFYILIVNMHPIYSLFILNSSGLQFRLWHNVIHSQCRWHHYIIQSGSCVLPLCIGEGGCLPTRESDGSIPGPAKRRADVSLGKTVNPTLLLGLFLWMLVADGTVFGSSSHLGVNGWTMTWSIKVFWLIGRVEKCCTIFIWTFQ